MAAQVRCPVVLALVALGACAPATFAQTLGGDTKPLFGDVRQSGDPRAPVDVSVSLSRTHDEDLAVEQGTSQFDARIGGAHFDLDVAASIVHKRRRFGIGARVESAVRYYPVLNDAVASSHVGGVSLTTAWGPKTTIQANLDGSYVSNSAYDTFSRRSVLDQGALALTGLKDASVDWPTTSYGATASLTRTVGPRSSVSVSYGARYAERAVLGDRDSFYAIEADFARNTGRDAVVRFGYSFRRGTQRSEFGTRPQSDYEAKVGLERRWRHRAGRRTVLTVSGGPSLLQEELNLVGVDATPEVLPRSERARLVRAVGLLALNHQIGYRWTAQLTYRRGAGLRDVVVSSNNVVAEIDARLGRRVDVTMSAGYSDGDIGLESLDNQYTTASGSTRVRVAISRHVAAYTQYFAYHYDLGSQTLLPVDAPLYIHRPRSTSWSYHLGTSAMRMTT